MLEGDRGPPGREGSRMAGVSPAGGRRCARRLSARAVGGAPAAGKRCWRQRVNAPPPALEARRGRRARRGGRRERSRGTCARRWGRTEPPSRAARAARSRAGVRDASPAARWQRQRGEEGGGQGPHLFIAAGGGFRPQAIYQGFHALEVEEGGRRWETEEGRRKKGGNERDGSRKRGGRKWGVKKEEVGGTMNKRGQRKRGEARKRNETQGSTHQQF